MKSNIFFGFVFFLACGCSGLNKQVNQIKALENCKYEIQSADSISVANVNIQDLLGKDKFDLLKMPRIALALLRRNVPLKGRINLQIHNPANQLAAINQFEYKVLIKSKELASGFVNQKISVSPGETISVPIEINSNIYDVLSDQKALDAVYDFIIGAEDGRERKQSFSVKIKPTLDFGNRQIQYPGYITIEKEVGSKELLR